MIASPHLVQRKMHTDLAPCLEPNELQRTAGFIDKNCCIGLLRLLYAKFATPLLGRFLPLGYLQITTQPDKGTT